MNQDLLFRAMERVGIPPSWIQALRTLYSVSTSRFLINGHPTAPIPLGRGVRQGCPLSPLLFLVSIEPLACLIRQSQEIKALHTDQNATAIRLLMYADDVTLILRDWADLTAASAIIALYERAFGAKQNAAKSELIRITEAWFIFTKGFRNGWKSMEFSG